MTGQDQISLQSLDLVSRTPERGLRRPPRCRPSSCRAWSGDGKLFVGIAGVDDSELSAVFDDEPFDQLGTESVDATATSWATVLRSATKPTDDSSETGRDSIVCLCAWSTTWAEIQPGWQRGNENEQRVDLADDCCHLGGDLDNEHGLA